MNTNVVPSLWLHPLYETPYVYREYIQVSFCQVVTSNMQGEQSAIFHVLFLRNVDELGTFCVLFISCSSSLVFTATPPPNTRTSHTDNDSPEEHLLSEPSLPGSHTYIRTYIRCYAVDGQSL